MKIHLMWHWKYSLLRGLGVMTLDLFSKDVILALLIMILKLPNSKKSKQMSFHSKSQLSGLGMQLNQ